MPSSILIIEDEPAIASALQMRLTALGNTVATAADGTTGLDAARRDVPDAILLDIRLPGMDGIKVCRQLKNDKATAHVPTLILSANINSATREEAHNAGAVACLSKPYEIGDVAHAIDNAIRSRPHTSTDGEAHE